MILLLIITVRAGEIDKPEMALQFTRMAGMTGGSMACFYFATAAVSSTGVGLAIGAVACIGLGKTSYFQDCLLFFSVQISKFIFQSLNSETKVSKLTL